MATDGGVGTGLWMGVEGNNSAGEVLSRVCMTQTSSENLNRC
jgi:hypothetical protein